MFKFISLITVFLFFSCSDTNEQLIFKDQIQVTSKPQLFFPGNVTLRNKVHFNSSLSSDGKTIVYTTKDKNNRSVASFQTFMENKFSDIHPISSDTVYAYGDPSISSDGKSVYLSSTRPINPNDTATSGYHIWKFDRNETGWNNGVIVPLEMDSYVGYPTLTNNKTLYFQSFSKESSMDIFYSSFVNNKYSKPIKLPTHISGSKFEGDPFIDKDERFLIFAGFDREVNFGRSDLYISFKVGDNWTEAINLGREINSHGYDGSPHLSSDKKILFFTSSRHPEKSDEEEKFNVFYVAFDLKKYQPQTINE